MCTLTWSRAGGRLAVLVNRDERRTRRRALPPRREVRDGVRIVRPVDGDHGGSWIAANEHGVIVALLNGDSAPPAPRAPDAPSRGWIVRALAAADSAAAAIERFDALEIDRFAPFYLAVFGGPEGPDRLVVWTGDALERKVLRREDRPLVSSVLERARVHAWRRALFARVAGGREPTLERLESFHRSHEPEPGPLSVCMHRPEAETVSLTVVLVDRRQVVMRYEGDAPCRHAPVVTVRIER